MSPHTNVKNDGSNLDACTKKLTQHYSPNSYCSRLLPLVKGRIHEQSLLTFVVKFRYIPKVSNPEQATHSTGFPRSALYLFGVHCFLVLVEGAPRRGAMKQVPNMKEGELH
jgi:hypothetical protein